MLSAGVAGLLTGLSLIVAIGVQNAFVLRQGLRRSYVGEVVLLCTVSDLVLIACGVTGIGAIVARASWVLTLVRWIGVVFLVWYAAGSLRRATHKESLAASGTNGSESRGRVLGKTAALTWLNPNVYLDTMFLLGSIANTHGSSGRWAFAVGAGLASVLWFSLLGFGSSLAAPLLARPRAWQVLEVAIAVVVLVVAARLAFG